MSPDLNPIEHIWDMLGRCIHAQESPVQNIRQLEAALHREWQHLQQYFSYIMAVSFIGGGNRRTRRKPSTCRKSLTNIITVIMLYTSP
jgi:hypothetical protein